MMRFLKYVAVLVGVALLALSACAAQAGQTQIQKTSVGGKPCLSLSNGATEFSIDATRFTLVAIRDVRQGINYVREPGGGLFLVGLNQPAYEYWQTRKVYSIDGSSADKHTYAFTRTASGGVLTLNYVNCRIGEFGRGADVTVTVSLSDNDPVLRFGLKIRNTSGTPLYSVHFPTLQGIASSLKGSEKTDYYIGSYASGLKVMSPRENVGFGEGFGNYPGNGIAVQLHCYSDGMNKGSLYLAVEDTTRGRKAFCAEPMKSKKSFGWNILYYYDGESDKVGNWNLPFQVAVAPISGDWYDAAKLYRKWALSSGIIKPLRDRKDIPAWFYDAATVMEAVFRGEKAADMDAVAENMLRTRAALGEDYILHAYKWYKGADEDDRCPPDYHAKDGFREAVARLQTAGIHVMPYMNLSLFDTKTPKWQADKPEQWANRNEDGSITPRMAQEPFYSDIHMCAATDYWQNTMVDLAKYIVNDVGADSIYLDELHVHPWLCFATNHKHKAQGGNYLTESYRKIIDRMRTETGKPDLVIMGECATETYADKATSNLVGHYDFDPFSDPVLQAVMHDCIVETGVGTVRPEAEQMDMWAAKQGFCFVRGKQFGWLVAPDTFSPWDPKLAPQMKYLHALGECRRACKDYLIFGDFLREPDMSANPHHEVGWSQVWGTHPKPIQLPNVLASSYKAPDGSLGLVLVNTMPTPQSVSIPINSKDWGIKPGSAYLMSVWQEGSWSQPESAVLPKTLRTELPAYLPQVIRLKTAPAPGPIIHTKGNPMKNHRFIFNQDCNDVTYAAYGQADPQAYIRDWFSRAFAAGAGVLVADVALPDVVETKDTPTGERIGERFGKTAEGKEVSAGGVPVEAGGWYGTNRILYAQGTDVLHLACEETRKAKGVVLAGMRMSDAHHGPKWQATSDSPLFAQVVMDHPEWCNTWPDGRIDATLNYAVPQVQAHRLQILRELATNYDVDGLELDWMRWCRHFPAGKQREHLADLTGFVRQVREMLDEVAVKKGRTRMVLGHRVPVTLEESLDIGCDVTTWAKKGYADYLAPMDFLFNDLNVRTDEFVKAVRGTNCLVYPGFGSTKYSFGYKEVGYDDRVDADKVVFMRTLDEYRATAANWYAWGAKGGSAFNMYLWPSGEQEFYAGAIEIMSDPKKAMAGPRLYVYLPTWKDGENPTGRLSTQILTLGADTIGKRQSFTFRMADGRKGEKLKGKLTFRIYGATAEDQFTVDLNGKPFKAGAMKVKYLPQGEPFEKPTGSPSLPGGSFVWPPHLRFEVALEDCPPFKGDNELGLTLDKLSSQKPPTMEALEVRVK